jgi:ribokinase
VAGSINMDLVVRSTRLPRRGETVIGRETQELPGGKGANQAVAAARLQADVSFIGRVGDDGFGQRLLNGLRQEGIDVGRVAVTAQCASVWQSLPSKTVARIRSPSFPAQTVD